MIDQKIFDRNCDFIGAKGLVFIGDKILVYRRDTNTNLFPLHIDLPGGGKEDGESPFDTFKREVKEEFGLEINSTDIEYAKSYMSTVDLTKETFFIVARPAGVKQNDIVFGDEGVEFMLTTLDEYMKLSDAIKRHQDRVADYLNTNKK
ncbi:MAG: NUDIX domain-containing protein [bacterium]